MERERERQSDRQGMEERERDEGTVQVEHKKPSAPQTEEVVIVPKRLFWALIQETKKLLGHC